MLHRFTLATLAILLAASPALAQFATPLGTYATGIFDEGAAEIVAYDADLQRLYFINADANEVQALDIRNPSNPRLIGTRALPGGAATSVATANGVIAVTVSSDTPGVDGEVVFFSPGGDVLATVPVGDLPDSIALTEDGAYAVVANEGEPSDDGTVDPEGSITVIDVATYTPYTVTLDAFNAGNAREAEVTSQPSIRIFGPGASVAQDLEPEFVTISPDGTTAFVTIQENNAVAVIDIATALTSSGTSDAVTALVGLGFKDWSASAQGLDASDRDGKRTQRKLPVFGMYQPDGADAFMAGGQTYLAVANEGDARDYDFFSEEERIKDLALDPDAFPFSTDVLQADEIAGRLQITTTLGDPDMDGEYEALYSYGSRSFSIHDATGARIFDSDGEIEKVIADLTRSGALPRAAHNATNDDNDSFDNRSDNKGPEPEGVVIGEVNGELYAFVGLERVSAVAVYNVTDPANAFYVDLLINRDFEADVESPEAGDLGPEGLVFIPAADSPNGLPLLVTSNEVSGTISIWGIGAPAPDDTFTLTILHNNDGESDLLGFEVDGIPYGSVARFATVVENARQRAAMETDGSILISSGDTFLPGPELNASLEDGVFYDALALGTIGYDALAIGNHEFDLGPDALEDFISTYADRAGLNALPVSARARFLSANLDVSSEAGLQALADVGILVDRRVLNVNGRAVGIIGATTPELPFISSPRGVVVDPDVASVVQAQIDALEAAGVNVIILTSHLQGVDSDIDLVKQLSGLDVVIAGGGDELLANSFNLLIPGDEAAAGYPFRAKDAEGETVPVVTTAGGYRYLGRLVVSFDEDGELTDVDRRASGPIRVAGGAAPDAVMPNATIQADVVAPVAASVAALAANVIATSEVDLSSERAIVRTQEGTLGNLIADAILSRSQELAPDFGVTAPQVAIQNGGGIRADRVFPAGDITELNTFDILPFTNFLTVFETVPADRLKAVLENAYSRLPNQGGQFAQIAGFSVIIDPSEPAREVDEDGNVTEEGSRVRSVVLDDATVLVEAGEVVEAAPSVALATIDFLARGGDRYPYDGLAFTVLGETYQSALEDFLTTDLGGVVTAAAYPLGGEGRITIVGADALTATTPSAASLTAVEFQVRGAMPNPARSQTALVFDLPADATVSVALYDALGRRVADVARPMTAGADQRLALPTASLPAGVYVYRLEAGDEVATGRLTVVR
ncbi:MAG: choice-of-anchor I family protein [Bacteroidota bacterium]